jgi:D-sedoheptulose 7-phosphate isomerase
VIDTNYTKEYLRAIAGILDQLESGPIMTSTRILLDAYNSGKTVFIAGNGGSAAIASHLACDLEKTVAGPRGRRATRRLRAVSLSDNVATLTAWANDEGYENVFSERLLAHADPGDVLLVISSSGNSPNILEALRVARELDMRTIAWVGFGGGGALELAECCVHVAIDDYGMAEGIHGVIGHLVTDLVVQGVRGAQRPSYVPSAPRIAVGVK